MQQIKSYAENDNDFAWVIANIEYRGKGKTADNRPDLIIAYDKTTLSKNPDGTNVLYDDAHVAFERADWLKKAASLESLFSARVR